MQKFILTLTFLIAALCSGFSQKTNNVYVELGGARGSFQDLKYSAARYAGFGAQLNFGFESSSPKAIWGYGLNIQGTSETTKLHDFGKSLTISPMVQFKYLKGISEQLYVGATWDIISGNYRNINGLGNNGNYILGSSNLFASGVYKLDKLTFGIDLALLSLVKEGTSFAFSAPQKGLEDGAFTYQNESLTNPLPLSYAPLRTPNRHFIIRTNITYQLADRLTVGYRWNMKKYNEVKGYGTTMGTSAIVLRWNFINKQKEVAQN